MKNLKIGRHLQHNRIWYRYLLPKLLNPKYLHVNELGWQPIYKWTFWYITFKP